MMYCFKECRECQCGEGSNKVIVESDKVEAAPADPYLKDLKRKRVRRVVITKRSNPIISANLKFDNQGTKVEMLITENWYPHGLVIGRKVAFLNPNVCHSAYNYAHNLLGGDIPALEKQNLVSLCKRIQGLLNKANNHDLFGRQLS